ncbi:putative metal-binding motif-containing protein, partial [Christiangramia aquimixticola]|uniref:putative metal-binding motif-containing protein n=1 Tax=Christiangramia aquimixticola TaxID=1697558 RepID=UPI003AA8F250
INPDTVWYVGVDNDADGFFGSTNSVTQCTSPGAGYSTTAPATPDCNDNDNTVYPNAPELCDGKDNDCDGTIDEDLTFTNYYIDADKDGFGDASDSG